ncbi:hypothetical protein BMAFMH_I0186 [Burkholderia mallei FMH]|nr:hypothetical protein BMAFMH_I0186 [Burkholderia mallei FMH]
MRETSTDANEARRQPLHRPAEQRVAASDRPGRARGLCGTRRHTRDARTARPGHAGDSRLRESPPAHRRRRAPIETSSTTPPGRAPRRARACDRSRRANRS